MGMSPWLPACMIQKIPSSPQEPTLHSPLPGINSGSKRVRPIPPFPFPTRGLAAQGAEQTWSRPGGMRAQPEVTVRRSSPVRPVILRGSRAWPRAYWLCAFSPQCRQP